MAQGGFDGFGLGGPGPPWHPMFGPPLQQRQLPMPSDPNEAIQLMRNLQEQGNAQFKEGRYPSAIRIYETALQICEAHGFEESAVKLHSNAAAVLLKLNDFEAANGHAEQCIALDPEFAKGYFRQAEACKMHGTFLCKRGPSRHAATAFQRAVQSYIECYHRSKPKDVDLLCQAITLAVDCKCTRLLKLKQLNIQQTDFVELLLKLFCKPDTKCEHVKFLLVPMAEVQGSGFARQLPVNLSKVSCSLLFHKKDLDVATMEAILGQGATIAPSHIEKAIGILPESSLEVLKCITSACSPRLQQVDIDSLCEKALDGKKPQFAAHFVSSGAKPDPCKVKKSLNWKSTDISEELALYLAEQSGSESSDIVLQALKHHHYELALMILKAGAVHQFVNDLGQLIASTSIASNPDLFQQLLDVGFSPNGTCSSAVRPLDAVLSLKHHSAEGKIPLICSLLDNGADLDNVCTPRQEGTTIIHKVTEIALETGNTRVLEKVCSKFNFPENGRVTNKRGQTPFHVAMAAKRSQLHTSENVCTVLSQFHIDPDVSDHSGKKPTDGRPRSDKRIQILQEASQRFKSSRSVDKEPKSGKSKRKRPRKKAKEKERAMNDQKPEEAWDFDEHLDDMPVDLNAKSIPTTVTSIASADNPILVSAKETLEVILSHKDDYFNAPAALKEETQTKVLEAASKPENRCPPLSQRDECCTERKSAGPTNLESVEHSSDESSDEEVPSKLLPDFDDLPWEVECPEKVVKFFKDKRTPHWLRQQAVEKIRMIAEGQWHGKLCKRVGSKPGLCLFEGRVTKSVRILWEVAVQFSARCTNKLTSGSTADTSAKILHVYSEVIRVWDIVLDHDRLDHCIRNVERSHERGHQASVKIPLSQGTESPDSKERVPRMFLLGTEMEETEALKGIAKKLQFVPAGSTKDDEYNVITFYSFSNAFARSMLEGENARRDFPFKEWPKEHDIINLPEGRESILLLGRSGTGKTTCCLYRLWNHFQTYWSMAQHAGPLIARKALIYDQERDAVNGCEGEFIPGSTETSSDSTEPADPPNPQPQPAVSGAAGQVSEDVSEHCSDVYPDTALPERLEHLHQVFITKNYVLCSQMRKRFYDMAAANESAKEHIPFEDEEIANSLSSVNDLAYPLFLTTRQFLLLLDNSLTGGKSFFPRAEDGSLKVKILSSDYDHEDPDTLLDLEESESEDEGDFAEFEEYGFHQTNPKQQLQEWREVTASYFAEQVWPKISHACSDKATDPLLVWMEIKSFIKGSREAVEMECGYLNEKEYEQLGKKMAPNFDGNRSEVYTLFRHYQTFLERKRGLNLFDECDFIHDLYQRLSLLKDVPWSLHRFYVDEVQDFTQAELLVLLRCCREPNGLFLTGDTAQSIMRGVSFRFGDLRSLFHEVQQKAKHAKAAVPIHIPELHQLIINFRSHSGILQLAASVIDLLKEFFPNSFDCLPGDEGMFPGPTPTLLQSCNVSDLALLLRSNKREASSIEFGAHQVIIVQSDDSKKELPDVLKAGIVLTVFEAKGLEFDDVLLYNFFSDSKISKEWRVVASFGDHNPVMIQSSVPVFESQPRPLTFDGRQHKSLNPELKYLYTAITRAKCNLWIYDSDEDKRLPVFDYWCKRNLVKVVRVDGASEEDQNVLFAATSTPEEWKDQGDYFKKKHLWEPAMKCYQKAGSDDLEMEAKAYFMAQQAHGQRPKEMHQLYLEAALAFLQCDQLKHDVKYLINAAKCLKNAKRHSEAAELFERLGQYEQAFRGFMRSKNVEGCAKLREKAGDYAGAIKLYINFNCRIDALARAAAYESKGIVLPRDVSVAFLAHTFAKIYCRYKDKTKLLKVLGYMSDASQRTRFLKEANLFSKAVEVHVQQGQYTEAYQILTAQARHKEGIELAEKQGDESMMARFTIQKVVTELLSNGSLNDPDTVDRLQHIAVGKNTDLKAQACLLLGKSKKDSAMCRKAFDLYKSFNPSHGIGEVESFKAFAELNPQLDRPLQVIRPLIEACKAAKFILKAIESRKNPTITASYRHILEEVEDFYSLQKQGESDVYIFPKSQDLWAKLVDCSTASSELDPDGMLKLDAALTLRTISEHLNVYLTEWMQKDSLSVCQALKTRLGSVPFHKPLCEGGFLQQSFTNYPPRELKDYISLCLLALDTVHCGGKLFTSAMITRILQNLFSPQAAVHLPVSKLHLDTIRRSELACNELKEATASTLTRDAFHFGMDEWLEAWRIYCMLGKGTQRMESVLNESQRQVNIKAVGAQKVPRHGPTSHSQKSEPLHQPPTQEIQDERSRSDRRDYKPPHAFVYYARQNSYDHIFSLFLKSCTFIRSGKVLSASKLVLHYIVKTIANRRSLASSISVTNLVNIACIHSIALLGLATHCYFLLKQPSTILVPHTYKHIAQVFDDLSGQSPRDKWLLPACMEDVAVQKCPRSDLPQLIRDILELLQLLLDVLLGRYNKHFHVLRYAIRSGHCLQNGEAKHCLILVLTLFGNLASSNFWSDQQLHDYQRGIFEALVQLPDHQTLLSLKRAQNMFISSSDISGSFLALSQLLDRSGHLLRFTVVQKQKMFPKLELAQFVLRQLPQRPMMSIHQQIQQQTPVHPLSPSVQSPITFLQGEPQVEASTKLGVLQKLFPAASQSPPGSTPMQSPPAWSTHMQSPPGSSHVQSPPGSTHMQSPPVSTHMQSPPGSAHMQSLSGPQQLEVVSDPHQMFSRAVQATFDWRQVPVAQAHPLTAQFSALGSSHEVQAAVGLSPWQQEQHAVITPEMPQTLRSMSYPEPEGEEQDEQESEIVPNVDDEDIREAFTSEVAVAESQQFGESRITEATAVGGGHRSDHSMIDENLCRFCGVPLRQLKTAQSSVVENWEDDLLESEEVEREGKLAGSIPVDTSVETYQDHVESDHHKTQERLYIEFSQEVNDWQYSELKSELKKILADCKAFDEAMIERDLDLALTDIKVELDRNEKRIEEMRRSCDWRSGLWEVQNRMVSQMKSLMGRGRQEQKRTEQRIQQAIKKQLVTEAPDNLLQEDVYDAPEEIEQAGPLNMEGEKTRKRMKKKHHKKTRK